MPQCVLPDRTLIAVTGPDAEHLLHNVLTADIETLQTGIARACALLTPQGKVLFDFLVGRDDDGYVIDIAGETVDGFLKRMMLYKLRSKVEFAKRDEQVVAVSWDRDSGSSDTDSTAGLADTRFTQIAVTRHVTASATGSDATPPDAWHALRIAHGVAESGTDFALGDVFGHDISYDHNGGIDFKKGCFVGQEVVSRMQHRGTARRRVVIVEGGGALPATGTEITAGGKPVGALGTVVDNRARAIVRLDRVRSARDKGEPVLAGEQTVAIDLPAGAKYAWPETATGDA